MKRYFSFYCFVLVLILFSCAGTLGEINSSFKFNIKNQALKKAIDSLYQKYPRYKMPEKWTIFNNWSERGYDFLEGKIFYFSSPPEEMYYVTLIEYPKMKSSEIGIRAIHNDNGGYKWLLEHDLTEKEKTRIKKRFNDEIIKKLENITNTKSE